MNGALVRLLAAAALLWVAPGALGAQARQGAGSPAGEVRDLDEDGQLRQLPRLPQGMTLDMIRQGDAVFHGKGGCITCHGPDAGGMPASGSGITAGLHFVPTEWAPIEALIRTGIPEPTTRSPIAMPRRGGQGNLTDDELRQVAAYVWAISQVKDEPWPGGHRTHGGQPQDTTR